MNHVAKRLGSALRKLTKKLSSMRMLSCFFVYYYIFHFKNKKHLDKVNSIPLFIFEKIQKLKGG